MKKFLALITILAMTTLNPVGYAQPAAMAPVLAQMNPLTQVGVIAGVTGKVQLEKQGRVGQVVESGAQVFKGDIIKTDAGSTIQLMMMDETIFTVGPETTMKIDEYEYNPKNDAGKISAEMIEGTVKFITGKIGQKKPENMEIKLPTGVMGVRGTIGYVKVKDGKSTGILGGPGSDHNTPHRIGKIVMKSKDGSGKFKETYVTKPGNASTINGPGEAPTPSFTFPKVEFTQMKEGFSKPAPVKKQAAAHVGGTQKQKVRNDGEQKTGTVGRLSGQNKAKGFGHLRDTRSVGKFHRASDKIVSNEGSETGNQINIENGPAKFQDLLTINTGKFHYKSTNTFSGSGGAGVYTIYYNIDFGAKQMGGPNSRVDGDVTSGTMQDFNIPLEMRTFDGLSGEARVEYKNAPGGNAFGTCGTSCSGDVTIEFVNFNGVAARGIKHTVKVTESALSVEGSGVAQRQEGFTP